MGKRKIVEEIMQPQRVSVSHVISILIIAKKCQRHQELHLVMLRALYRTFCALSRHYQLPPARPLIPESVRANAKPLQRPIIPANPSCLTILQPELERLRVVPSLPAFYAGSPIHDRNVSELQRMVRKYINLPTVQLLDSQLRQMRFLSIETHRQQVQLGTRLKTVHFKELTSLLHRLRSIDPQLMPRDVYQLLSRYFVDVQSASGSNLKKEPSLDQYGRAVGKAKRKEARAHVYVVKGQGEILVNGQLVTKYFAEETWRRRLAFPFQVIGQEGQYNVSAAVRGGGKSGQAEAIMYAISKAMIVFNPLLKPRMYKAGLMTSDARVVERKKPGKVKARKAPTWVKR